MAVKFGSLEILEVIINILLTGVTSFSGAAIARELCARYPDVNIWAPLSRERSQYAGLHADRLSTLNDRVELVETCAVGSKNFMNLIRRQAFEKVVLHHASVGDYKSERFDVTGAIKVSTRNSAKIARVLATQGTRNVFLTRSIFEAGMGTRSTPRAVSPYAIAKSAVAEIWADSFKPFRITTKDFVITNPFGPLEEKRMVHYLVSSWRNQAVPVLQSPHYIRDNIPIDLLAKSYADFVMSNPAGEMRLVPSFQPQSNLDFARQLAAKFQPYFAGDCVVGSASSRSNSEPLVLIGQDAVQFANDSEETHFWDSYIRFYLGEIEHED